MGKVLILTGKDLGVVRESDEIVREGVVMF